MTSPSASSTTPRDLTRFAWLSIAAAVITIALKTGAWYVTGSVGLLSDAAESVVNLVAAFFALAALRVAARPADKSHHFGHSKAEYFSAGAEGVMIFVAAVFIIVAAIPRLLAPTPLENVGIGLAVIGRTPLRLLAPLVGWGCAMVLHALWNGGASLGFGGWLGSYLLVEMPVFMGAVGFALWVRHRENALVARHLTGYTVTGLLRRDELAMLADPVRRRTARRWAGEVAGRRGRRAMRDFQDDAIELAFLRARHERGRAGADVAHDERILIDSLLRARREFTGATPPPR